MYLSCAAYASGDIVYSARYYYPPGTKATSHFHLYRINPDGMGKRQITFGNSEEFDPHWSPDGQWILFERDIYPDIDSYAHSSLCCVPAGGGPVRKILDLGTADAEDWEYPRWSPDSRTISIARTVIRKNTSSSSIYLIDFRTGKQHRIPGPSRFEWSPDGKNALIENAQKYGIYDLKTGLTSAVPKADRFPIWLDKATIATLNIRVEHDDNDQYDLLVLGLNGQEQKRIKLAFSANLYGSDPDILHTTPDRQHVIDAYNNHNSTVGVDFLYFDVNLKTDKSRYFTEGQFLAWSPDGKRFCTAPGRDTTPYEKRPLPYPSTGPNDVDAKYRMVWYAPLYIRATSGGSMRQITPRLSWVTGADWRKAGR